jgi:hypothetical protein
MKRFALPMTFLFTFFVSGQVQKAISESGKEIVLFDDGTWRFAHDSDARTLETITTNPKSFSKSAELVKPAHSTKVNMVVYYDPAKWKAAPNRLHNMEYFFTGQHNMFGSLTTEKTQVPNLRIVKDLIVANVQQSVDYFRLKESEYRKVNGKTMLYMRYIANLRGLDFEYAGYYYITKMGFAMLVGYSMQNDFERNLPELQKFLNGFVEVDSPAEPLRPPPPIQLKP